jgi:hypothetical protein
MKKRKAKKVAPKEPKPAPPAPIEKSDEPFDFGGLPSRDLKKNLGCG